jgi:hypothetical protein
MKAIRVAILATASVFGLVTATRAGSDNAAAVRILRVPDGGLQPQVLVDGRGVLHLVYLNGSTDASDVWYSTRQPGAADSSKPIRINKNAGSAIAIGTVRGAQFALGRDGWIHLVWNGSGKSQPETAVGGGSALWYTRGRVSGAGLNFEPERNLIGRTTQLDGGGSVGADSQGNVFVVWHAHPAGAAADELHRRVFLARSTDDGRNFDVERPVNRESSGACGCCGLKAFADSRSRLSILYRDADAVGNRDMTLLTSTDHGLTFDSQVIGPWRASTCPMSTQSLSEGRDGALWAAFENGGQVFRALIAANSSGSSGTVRAPAGNAGSRKHPVLVASASTGAGSLMVWTEGTGWAKGGSLVWEWTDAAAGKTMRESAAGVPVWGSVAVAAERDGTFTIVY